MSMWLILPYLTISVFSFIYPWFLPHKSNQILLGERYFNDNSSALFEKVISILLPLTSADDLMDNLNSKIEKKKKK